MSFVLFPNDLESGNKHPELPKVKWTSNSLIVIRVIIFLFDAGVLGASAATVSHNRSAWVFLGSVSASIENLLSELPTDVSIMTPYSPLPP